VRAKLLARKGDHREAEKLADDAVSLLEQTDMLDAHAHALADGAEVLAAAGRNAEATERLDHALALFERKGNVVLAESARADLARLAEAAPTPS
jgi:hypothetical protein